MSKAPVQKTENGVPLRRRALTVVSSSANIETRTVPMIVATETPAMQYVPNPADGGRSYIAAMEILSMDGVDYSRSHGMPFVDSHDTYTSIDRVLGSVVGLRREGVALVADAVFRRRHAELVQDIADGHLQQVSVGYQVHEYELIGQDEATGLPLVKAIRWCPHEVSSVAVGADAGAIMRSQNEQLFPAPVYVRSAPMKRSKEKKSMEDLETLLAAAEEAVTAADEAVAALADVAEDDASDEVKARLAKLRARAEGDDETAAEGADAAAEATADEGSASETEEDKKAETEARRLAKARGKDTSEFVESLVGLKRGLEIKKLLGDFIAARAIAQVSAPAASLTPVVEKARGARSAEVAKALDPSAVFAKRKLAMSRN